MKAIGLLAVVSLLAVIFPVGCLYLESPSRYYESHEDALYGGMWVPGIFPSDIREIHEQHNLDSNEVWLRFRSGPGGFHPRGHGFDEIRLSELQAIRSSDPFMVGWWFDRDQERPSRKLYKGRCYPQRDAGGKVAFILETPEYFYWWCQHP